MCRNGCTRLKSEMRRGRLAAILSSHQRHVGVSSKHSSINFLDERLLQTPTVSVYAFFNESLPEATCKGYPTAPSGGGFEFGDVCTF